LTACLLLALCRDLSLMVHAVQVSIVSSAITQSALLNHEVYLIEYVRPTKLRPPEMLCSDSHQVG
jgi:hypothetical protein